ncbi:hypothetical protein Bca4012_065864 [Brassica carinata]
MMREGHEDEEMMMMVARKPAWLEGLTAETFFASCGVHESRRKSEKNVFCLLCCLSVCPHCLISHRSHPLLQVRRYVYHDVVRLSDLEKLIDCSYIQVDYLLYQGDDLSRILYRIDESDFTFSSLRMDVHDQLGEISAMEEDNDDIMVISDKWEQGNNSNKKEKKKKKKETDYSSGMVLSLGSRRKGNIVKWSIKKWIRSLGNFIGRRKRPRQVFRIVQSKNGYV